MALQGMAGVLFVKVWTSGDETWCPQPRALGTQVHVLQEPQQLAALWLLILNVAKASYISNRPRHDVGNYFVLDFSLIGLLER